MITYYQQLANLRSMFTQLIAMIPDNDWNSPKYQSSIHEIGKLSKMIEALEHITDTMESTMPIEFKKQRILPYLMRLKRLGLSNFELDLDYFINTLQT